MSEHILVVDDEPELVQNLEYRLRQQGFRVSSALNGRTALMQIGRSPIPDLILLDLMLPDMKGTDILRRIRANSETAHIPVIMVTAMGEEIDRVLGFELGVDDYVVKPFSSRELLLRIRAVIRRNKDSPSNVRLHLGRLSIDPDAYQVRIDDREIPLTALEFRLLHTLVQRRGQVQTRDTLIEDVWEYQSGVNSRRRHTCETTPRKTGRQWGFD